MSQIKPSQSYIDESRAGALLEKWAPVLDYSSSNVKAIEDDHTRLNTAILLENQETWCIEEAGGGAPAPTSPGTAGGNAEYGGGGGAGSFANNGGSSIFGAGGGGSVLNGGAGSRGGEFGVYSTTVAQTGSGSVGANGKTRVGYGGGDGGSGGGGNNIVGGTGGAPGGGGGSGGYRSSGTGAIGKVGAVGEVRMFSW